MKAIKMVNELERKLRKEEKINRKIKKSTKGQSLKQLLLNEKGLVRVQAIFSRDDVIALKEKTGGLSIEDAIAKAVKYYLKFGP